MYNAIDDAMRMRIMRHQLDDLLTTMDPHKLLIVIVDLIKPELTRPMLIALRNSLNGKTDEQLDLLIAELKP